MRRHGKKYKNAAKKVAVRELISVKDALAKIKELAFARFDESIDADIVLGIDPTRGEQVVRGSVVLPHGRGRTIKVLVFAKGDKAEEAKNAGADYVGDQDLIDKIEGGWMDFSYAIATPDMMGVVGKVAKILGPRGLLPNKKLGTVTLDVAQVVEDLKKGQAFFRNDKAGIVHFTFGKTSFDLPKLEENFSAFVKALQSAKPASSKGKYLKKISLSSTMGLGFPLNPDELLR